VAFLYNLVWEYNFGEVTLNMREPRDRTAELKAAAGKLEIWRNDFCDTFEQDAVRLFTYKECWYCKYGNFGIFTANPTKNGVCKYKERLNGSIDS
jgi:hypothetical protein